MISYEQLGLAMAKIVAMFCFLELLFTGQTEESPYHNKQIQKGDIILGSLLPIHFSNGSENCGKLSILGFALSQALIFAVGEINNNQDLLPNVSLGYIIEDYCESPALAMKRTHELINNSSLAMPVIIGPVTSSTALLVGSLLQAVNVPAISPTATSEDLSRPLYRSFFRTISSDINQAKAIAQTIKHFKWKYIAAVALDNSYGRNGVKALERESILRGSFCLALKEYISSSTHLTLFAPIVAKLKQLQNVHVVVLWSTQSEAEGFVNEVRKQALFDKTWILSDGLTFEGRTYIEKNSDLFTGSLGILPFRHKQPRFKAFVEKQIASRRWCIEDSWWNEFWKLQAKQTDRNGCTGNVSVYKDWFSILDTAFLPYMVDAVFAAALALDNMLKCKEPNGLLKQGKCPKTKPHILPRDLSIYLRNLTFAGITGEIAFDKYGDPPDSSYEIVNFQRTIEQKTQISKLVQVGTWNKETFTLNTSLVKWSVLGRVPISVCIHKCKPGTMQTRTIACCWQCIKCPSNAVSTSYASINCSSCPMDQMSNSDRTRCIDLPVSNLTWVDAPSIICISSAILGIALCVAALLVLIKYKNTPLVKSSSFEMSIILLVFIAAHFATTVCEFAQLGDILCKIREPLRSASLTGCISILLLKTLRLVSAFQIVTLGDWFNKYFKNTMTQILAIVAMNIVQDTVHCIWLLVDSPYSHREIIARKNIFVSCKPYKTMKGKVCHGLAMGYLLVLCLVCTYYATKARKLPGNFNETRLIGFSMYTLLLSWITYYSVDFSLEGPYNSVVASSTVLMSSYALLCFMFAPKLNIILRYPHKNTPECVKSGVTRYTFDACSSHVNAVLSVTELRAIPKRRKSGENVQDEKEH